MLQKNKTRRKFLSVDNLLIRFKYIKCILENCKNILHSCINTMIYCNVLKCIKSNKEICVLNFQKMI